MAGKFITFEGIDGSGKSTQIKLLEEKFSELGIKYKTFREPGGTILSEKIREILLDRGIIGLSPIAESLLFAAARSQLVGEKIKPALDKFEFVICDRFIDSTIAYQGFGRGLKIESLQQLNKFAADSIIPDLTLIIDIDPRVGEQRQSNRSRDRMEESGGSFFDKIRMGYCDLHAQNTQRCVWIKGMQPRDKVFRDIFTEMINRFNKELKCS